MKKHTHKIIQKKYHRHKSLKEHSERITVSQIYMQTRKITFNQVSNYPKPLAKRYVFNFDLKDSTDEVLLISSGNLFHSVGAAKVKDLSLYDFNLNIGELLKRCSNFAFVG